MYTALKDLLYRAYKKGRQRGEDAAMLAFKKRSSRDDD
jgi:hypothetical protein